MGRRIATLAAASVAPNNDRRAVRRVANSLRAEPATPGAVSVTYSNERRAAPGATSRRRAAPVSLRVILGVGSTARRMVSRAGHAMTGHAMMGRVPTARVRVARGQKASGARGSHFKGAHARTITATETSSIAAMIVLGMARHRRTPRAARSGCMACTRLPPRWPIPRAGCAAWC